MLGAACFCAFFVLALDEMTLWVLRFRNQTAALPLGNELLHGGVIGAKWRIRWQGESRGRFPGDGNLLKMISRATMN